MPRSTVFGLDASTEPNLDRWRGVVRSVREPEGKVTIAVVGVHGTARRLQVAVEALTTVASARREGRARVDGFRDLQRDDAVSHLENVHGISDARAASASAAPKARSCGEVCARATCHSYLLRYADGGDRGRTVSWASRTPRRANSGPTDNAVVGLMTEWMKGNQVEKRAADGALGGTMRLGAYARTCGGHQGPWHLRQDVISERRRRHRYEVNVNYKDRLEQVGLRFTGHVAGWTAAGNRRDSGSSLVHRRAVPSRAEVAAVRAAPALHLVHRRGQDAEPAGLTGVRPVVVVFPSSFPGGITP